MSSSTMKIEPGYVVDTNALIWYLTTDKRLSERADSVFDAAERGETTLYISAIVVAELYYANKKWQIADDFSHFYNRIIDKPYFQFVPFLAEAVLDFDADSAVPEMHDRIIAGAARRLGVPLLTSDPLLAAANIATVVW